MLASLVSGQWREEDGVKEIFIDCDGERFKFILDYLRSDRVHLPDLSYQAALKKDLPIFSVMMQNWTKFLRAMDDLVTIDELSDEIIELEQKIEQKTKKIAAIKESYRVASEFSKVVDQFGLSVEIANIDELHSKFYVYSAHCLLSVELTVTFKARFEGTIRISS
jgi:hypothetical protein